MPDDPYREYYKQTTEAIKTISRVNRVMMALTVFLVLATWYQACQSKEANRTAFQALEGGNRAWIGVTGFRIGGITFGDTSAVVKKAQARVENFGPRVALNCFTRAYPTNNPESACVFAKVFCEQIRRELFSGAEPQLAFTLYPKQRPDFWDDAFAGSSELLHYATIPSIIYFGGCTVYRTSGFAKPHITRFIYTANVKNGQTDNWVSHNYCNYAD